MTSPLTRRMFIAAALSALAGAGHARPQSYELVAEGSRVAFIFTSNGASQSGTVPVQRADILVDRQNLSNSTAQVTADVRKVRSGLLLITQAIKSPELLDAATHPMVRFTSTRIRLGANGRISEGAQIEGQLTLRGVTRPITLDAVLSRPAGTAPDDLSVLFIQLNGELSRAAYGASGYAGLADDTVLLDIRAEIRARA
ncbi:YceI family protein [Roseobacter denitrificans]|uniref:Lipid/polyisoprenoid-binding YceI-like domain-containing protein n=1 Tax=Roseobacter denitrificans (strain ATCC 33942 / OCh 114) TaxID=375451 RepID=Q166L7_ROSDO|nr:YceI family protein [Roseobacter denitrificans]ABG32076.1 conserved hypothetical protein [Roseobacter denitrificans OCh 114]AVL51595.1 YceI family protein [Roseobacter denitrificans]SFF77023.1 Polyisoprenoid-binding protein YceI [Roseobacter denitrificans OCh 114]